MKKGHKIYIICIILFLVIGIIAAQAVTYVQATDETMYFAIEELRYRNEPYMGYAIGNPDTGSSNNSAKIWNIVQRSTSDSKDIIEGDFYCLKAEEGFHNTDSNVEYNLFFDIKTEKELMSKQNTILESITKGDVQTDDGGTVGKYECILAVLDMLYLPGSSDVEYKNQLLKDVIEFAKTQPAYNPYIELMEEYPLTDNDITAIQQAIIWYFTNYGELNGKYDKTNSIEWINYKLEDTNYDVLSSYKAYETGEGLARSYQAEAFYNYMIKKAKENASQYENGNIPTSSPINMITTDLQYEENNTNYIIGPIHMEEKPENDFYYTISSVLSYKGSEVKDYILLNSNKEEVEEGTTINDLVGEDFYISFKKSETPEKQENISVDFTIDYEVTETIVAASMDSDEEQPIGISQKQKLSSKENLSVTVEHKDFDLALRKYITSVNGVELIDTQSRVPNVLTDSLNTGTTATYNHKKDPVKVTTGSKVIYNITIFNEGEKAGRATKVVDQLPEGLKFSRVVSGNFELDSYSETDNRLNLKRVDGNTTNLPSYTEGNLSSETIEIECEVTMQAGETDKVLTNVAWISEEVDGETNEVITNEKEKDRDSEPGTTPDVNKDNMENYTGNNNKEDLTNPNNYYKGQQDDDDFEKLVIEAVTSVTVNKVWEDNNNQDGIREPEIEVVLVKNGAETETTKFLNEGNSWTATFDNLPLKENGVEIEYTIKEKTEIDGYTTEITENPDNNFTITNKHTPEVTSVTVNKVWEDNNNQDGIRPPEIEVVLVKNGEETSTTKILNEGNSWTETFDNLPLKENGEEIEYTVKEKTQISGYETEISESPDNNFTITNKHTPEVTSVTVNKVWNDNNNQDGIRAPEIEVVLVKNGKETSTTKILNEGNSWTETFNNLPLKENGVEIEYTVKEKTEIDGYTTEITENSDNNFTITNKHTPEVTNVTVNKVWQDNNNQDGIRPPEIEVVLVKNGEETSTTKILNEGNSWTETFDNLPLKENGEEIEYTVKEKTEIDGYTTEITENSDKNFTITNTHIVEKTFDLALRKYITSVNGVELIDTQSRVPNVLTDSLNTGTTATYNHKKDPVKVTTGSKVIYKITIFNEGEKAGRATKVVDQLPEGLKFLRVVSGNFVLDSYSETDNRLNLKRVDGNTNNLPAYTEGNLSAETIEIECEVTMQAGETDKVLTNVAWISEEIDGETNEVITNEKEKDRDSEPGTTPDVNKDNMENYTGNNNKEDLTDPNNYYKGQQDDDDFEKLVIEAVTSITVNKVWEDNNNQDGIRAPEIEVVLVKNGVETQTTKILNEGNSWTETFDNLPLKEDGKEIEYTVKEKTAIGGYTSEITENSKNNYTITNKHTPGLTSVIVNKVWKDEENYDKIRPPEIEVVLVKNGEETSTTAKLNEGNGWTATFENLPLKENGQEIEYTVKERTQVSGYITEITENSDNNFTITNTHIVEKTFDLALRKYITSVDGVELIDTQSRVPKVVTDTLNTGTTATYNHKKDPVEVTTGSKVIYKITIFNEGEKAGRATKVVDQLPEGLKFLRVVSGNFVLDSYSETDNRLNLKRIDGNTDNLPVYEEGNLSAETIEIECEVTMQAGETDKVLTNVAWISEEVDGETNEVITNEKEKDRDSEPGTTPDVNKDNMENYTGNENKEDLTDPNNYYKGQQDDDDFEKLIIKKAEGTYNLQLIKVDQTDTNKVLSGAEFKVTLPDGSVRNLTTNEQGTIAIDGINITEVGTDTIIIEETKAPTDYEKLVDSFAIQVTKQLVNNTYQVTEAVIAEDTNNSEGISVTLDGSIINIEVQNKEIPKPVDFKLIKRIVAVNNQNVPERIENVDVSKLNTLDENGELITTGEYTLNKEPVIVKKGDIVTYTLRVYNEGMINGYVQEITEDVPEGLEFLWSDKEGEDLENDSSLTEEEKEAIKFNKEYLWGNFKYDENKEKITQISSSYLSRENEAEEGENLISAFGENDGTKTEEDISYKEISVKFKVVEENITGEAIRNEAAITDDCNEEGEPVDDRDSKPEEWVKYEDDEDYDNVILKKFDLALRKWVTQAIVIDKNGETITETGHQPFDDPEEYVKVELDRKNLDEVTVKFRYSIRVYNEGEIEGYAKEVTDYIPEGLKFLAEDNPGWTDEGNNVISTRLLENTLLQPGEYADIEVVLTWINNPDNMGVKINTAEISEDYNEYEIPDDDSTPDNQEPGEDDIDDAPVILSIKTGQIRIYFALGFVVLTTIGAGVVLIKRFVL